MVIPMFSIKVSFIESPATKSFIKFVYTPFTTFSFFKYTIPEPVLARSYDLSIGIQLIAFAILPYNFLQNVLVAVKNPMSRLQYDKIIDPSTY